jgi:hypothetical protein
MRIAFLIAAVGFAAALTLAAQAASSPPGRTVPCSEIIGRTKFPYLGDYRANFRYRQVLGVVSAPPAFLKQVVPTNSRPWTHWRKQGLVIRASGESVTIVVPKGWRNRAAIAWGNGGHGPFSSLRIAGCGSNPSAGNAYAGGFYLRSRSACVPLIFRVGKRSATLRFGLGRGCG